MLTTAASTASPERKPELVGHTVVVIGAGAIGLETARRARAAGADIVLTGRDPERLERAALQLGARSTAAFDAGDQAAVARFFDGLPGPIDHVVVSAEGPHDVVSERIALDVARNVVAKLRPGGALLLMGGTAGRPFTAALAVALAPVRVRVELIAPGLVDTSWSVSDDVAALAVEAMANSTGASYGIDGGRQLLGRAA